ncbi:proline-rich protein 2-like isoform X3 [Gallus gallus]|uniref:proline-rich protein 2-like isoform X3 n=1 Tax=Gallus gallus TaxID=9031 RepID=UPI001F00218E|nr:proline-rich protein 2-like isoform X3 [Gallus gallus]
MARCPCRGRAAARRGYSLGASRRPYAPGRRRRRGARAGGEGAPRSPSGPRWAILHFPPRAAPPRRSPDAELPPPGPPYRKYPSASPPRSAGRRRGGAGAPRPRTLTPTRLHTHAGTRNAGWETLAPCAGGQRALPQDSCSCYFHSIGGDCPIVCSNEVCPPDGSTSRSNTILEFE